MNRIVVPPRRFSESYPFEHQGMKCRGSISYIKTDEGHRPVEIFLDCGKPGSALRESSRDSAVAASLGLQYGMTLEILRKAVTRDDNGVAAGPMGTFLDVVARETNG